MSIGRKKGGNSAKENGWYEVDILDLKILYEAMIDEVSRGEIKDKMDISKEKARIRLERLARFGVVDKREICRNCGEDISECGCGKYMKKIYYSRDAGEEEKNEMKGFIEAVNVMSEHIDIKNVTA
jgi:predicted ArsR family transcriptional regulator